MKPEVAVFTKDRPATKADFWNAFRGRRGFVSVQVDVARSVIGANAPRYWERKGYLVTKENNKGELVYELTEAGKTHLLEGIKRYLKNHPNDRDSLKNLPRDF